MPNTFGGYALYDPRHIREQRARYQRRFVPELEQANCLYNPGGYWPVLGWLLMTRQDLNKLDFYASHSLVIDDFQSGPLTFPDLCIVQARCVTRGLASANDAVYLVQVTDGVGIVYNQWWQFPTTSQYNMRAPAYPEQYYTASLNAGVPWTWDGMVGDLWNQMSVSLGAYPGLPSAPSGTPENFSFPGVSCWEALNNILNVIGMTVAGDVTSAVVPYAIVTPGTADATFTALQTKYADRLEDDFEYIDAGCGRVPKFVTVYFHRRNQYYGTEETIRRDSLQWSSTPLYSKTITGPYTSAEGTAYLWDDFAVRYDTDGNPLAADTAAADAIAAERATQLFSTIHRGTQGFMRQVYTGALPFSTGSLVDGVRWYQDFQDGRGGWRTEIVRGYTWPEVTFPLAMMGLNGPYG